MYISQKMNSANFYDDYFFSFNSSISWLRIPFFRHHSQPVSTEINLESKLQVFKCVLSYFF